MKIIYKCQYTGQEFDTIEDCEVHEYEHGEEKQKFYDLVGEFILKLENKYPNIKVIDESLKYGDKKEFYIQDRIVRDRYVKFDFTIDDERREYRRYSDEVGDCRWSWNIKDNVDSFILDFEKEFIYPNINVLEGVIRSEWDYEHDDGYIDTFGELDSNYFFSLLRNKKIRIEILEDFNENEGDEES